MEDERSFPCLSCQQAHAVPKQIDHDVGALLGMTSVVVKRMVAPVCPKCGWVEVPGQILDRVAMALGAFLLQQETLLPSEVRYLRKLVGDTQEEFGQRLGASRITVTRWEAPEAGRLDGTQAYAVRAHVYFRLRRRSPLIADAGHVFATLEHAPRHEGAYEIDAKEIAA